MTARPVPRHSERRFFVDPDLFPRSESFIAHLRACLARRVPLEKLR